jgi:(1->4)-alpha-D-glucan 1-alpha-D-glucosylmutase
VKTLKDAGLGLILDIVPNHMAASLENTWWRDVIENGQNSRFAKHFDINWSRPLTLPFLGDSFETALSNGDISVKPDPKTGKPAFAYYDSYYPLAPETYQGRETEVTKLTDKTSLVELHERQPYRLMSWREAPRDLSYRRFFEITGLAGVRVEDRQVFDDTHRLILELVHSGEVDGLRVDHVDGLADPKAYIELLRQEAGPDCYITVEKILGEGEHIPADWPISGTTGYEFIASLSDALVDGAKIDGLRKAYDDVVGKPVDMTAELRAAKLLMADKNFEGEFTTLLKLAVAIANTDGISVDEKTTRSALRELLVAFPVYRTYGTETGLPPEGHEMLKSVVDKVKQGPNAPDQAGLVRESLGRCGQFPHPLPAADRPADGKVRRGHAVLPSAYGACTQRSRRRTAAARFLDRAFPPRHGNKAAASAGCAVWDIHARHQARRRCPCPSLRADRGARTLGGVRCPLAQDERDEGRLAG